MPASRTYDAVVVGSGPNWPAAPAAAPPGPGTVWPARHALGAWAGGRGLYGHAGARFLCRARGPCHHATGRSADGSVWADAWHPRACGRLAVPTRGVATAG